MKAHHLLAVLGAAVALLLTACGGEPSAWAPEDVIAFGARDSPDAQESGLYLVRPNGADLRKLASETGAVSFPRWSPDGGRIAYAVVAQDQDRSGALRIYDFETGGALTVTEQALAGPSGPTFAWSPDGERLAFIEDAGGGLLRVYDVERGEPAGIPEVSATAAGWSPSGDQIALVRADAGAGRTDLSLVDADGEEQRPLLERPWAEAYAGWSADGERLAFWGVPAGRPGGRELLMLEPEGGRPTELGSGSDAAWSPEDRRLAFSDEAAEDGDANLDVYLLEAEGGERRPLSRAITVDRWPTWSPAGDRLAYLAQADRQTAFLCVVRLTPEGRDCLDLGELLPGAPAWSPQ